MKLTIALLLAISTFVSCGKDSNDNPGTGSRVVRYEVTGNFTGTATAAYTASSGGITSEDVTSLPWNKDVTYASSVSGASIVITGGGGTPGQKVTLVIKRGGTAVGTPREETVNNSGVFSLAAETIVF